MGSRWTFFKVIETPTTLEIYEYEKPISKSGKRNDAEDDIGEIKDDGTPAAKLRIEVAEALAKIEPQKPSRYDRIADREKQAKRNRWEVARLIECNKGETINSKGELLGMKFLTLTIADDNEDTHDVKWCNREFSKFMRRLNDYIFGRKSKMQLEYLAVNERQKRGVWHYHLVLFHFPYVPKEELQELWGLGFIDIQSLEHDKAGEPIRLGIATYISKYFTKSDVVRNYKQKTFFKSQNLIQPKETRFALPADASLEFLDGVGKEVFSKEYDRLYFDADSSECQPSKVLYRKFNKEV